MSNSTKIAIIDYGIGNLLSVQRGFEKIGCEAYIISTPGEILKSDKLILPGVGAFKDGMQSLNEHKLIDPILEYCRSGRPLLGICLGMQMLLTKSEEFGIFSGLDLIPGTVIPIPNIGQNSQYHKIPHIGWNSLQSLDQGTGTRSINLLNNIQANADVYFVHSFMAKVDDQKNYVSYVDYNGVHIPAIISKDNIVGCQFHPEKSGEVGLKILENFRNL